MEPSEMVSSDEVPGDASAIEGSAGGSTWRRPELIRFGLVNRDTAGISYCPLDGISNLSSVSCPR